LTKVSCDKSRYGNPNKIKTTVKQALDKNKRTTSRTTGQKRAILIWTLGKTSANRRTGWHENVRGCGDLTVNNVLLSNAK
jgi:hypothetical protein